MRSLKATQGFLCQLNMSSSQKWIYTKEKSKLMTELPPEVLSHIFSFLSSPRDLNSVCHTCVILYTIASLHLCEMRKKIRFEKKMRKSPSCEAECEK